MLCTMTMKADGVSTIARARVRAVELLTRFGADPTGSTVVEYGLMLAGIALGGSGLTAAIGLDLSAVFGGIELEFCKQLHSLCIVR